MTLLLIWYLEYERNQTTIRIDKGLKERIEKFLETEHAKELGYNHQANIINDAVRDLLKELEKPRFEHLNFHDNIIRLIDNDAPNGTPFIEIRVNSKSLTCGDCQAKDCIHIDAVRQDPKISKTLHEKGI